MPCRLTVAIYLTVTSNSATTAACSAGKIMKNVSDRVVAGFVDREAGSHE